ncbi:hypothetical protein HYW67_02575 [Candidatus Parcubacteria bacterium]|nr:hypothetical protein [Candidatus Parcubacteria bacterium]
MARELNVSGGSGARYACGVCGMQYLERSWAEQCEAWCREHGTCNMEIIRHAVSPATAPEETL